jgi:hypothetical protein
VRREISKCTPVKISLPVEASARRPKSVRDWPAFGFGADRDHIPDGISDEDASRNRRRE